MKEIIEESLVDVQAQVEQAKAKLNQLLGAESVLKLILEADKKQKEDELTKIEIEKELTQVSKKSKIKKAT